MSKALVCNPLRFENGWKLSPAEANGSICLHAFAPIGCSPLLVGELFTKQRDLQRFHQMILALPPLDPNGPRCDHLPKLENWEDFENGWSCKVTLDLGIRKNHAPFYLLWFKTPTTRVLRLGPWRWHYGRITLKATGSLTQKEAEKYIAYFRSI